MTIKKEPDDNIYCHQAPGYTAKIVKTIPYSIHIEKNNQEQYFDYPKNLKSYNINRKQIGFMKSTDCLYNQMFSSLYRETSLLFSFSFEHFSSHAQWCWKVPPNKSVWSLRKYVRAASGLL